MDRCEVYRQRAEDCLVTATFCKSPQRKALLTAMAYAWYRLAEPREPAGQGSPRHEQESAQAGRN